MRAVHVRPLGVVSSSLQGAVPSNIGKNMRRGQDYHACGQVADIRAGTGRRAAFLPHSAREVSRRHRGQP